MACLSVLWLIMTGNSFDFSEFKLNVKTVSTMRYKCNHMWLLLGLCLLLTGCTSLQLGYVNLAARFADYQHIADLVYDEQSQQHLDVYLASQPKPSQALIVFFYGGCWGACQPLEKEYYRFLAEALTSAGYAVVISDYRLYPNVKFADIMHDAVSTVKFAINHAARYGLNPHHVVLMGHSAGAHIAAMLTLNPAYLGQHDYPNIKGFVGLAGPYDFLPFTEAYQADLFGPASNYPNSQPVNFVHTEQPPLLLLHGRKDTIVRLKNLDSLKQHTLAINGCVSSHIYPELDHKTLIGAFTLPYQTSEPVLTDTIRFIDGIFSQTPCPA